MLWVSGNPAWSTQTMSSRAGIQRYEIHAPGSTLLAILKTVLQGWTLAMLTCQDLLSLSWESWPTFSTWRYLAITSLDLYQRKSVTWQNSSAWTFTRIISQGQFRHLWDTSLPWGLCKRVFSNSLTGPIPLSLGNLKSLQILELNSNLLTGTIPAELLNLIRFGNLNLFNVSDNLLQGTVHRTNSTVTTIIQDPQAQK